MEQIDKIVYINLEHRIDRKQLIEDELKNFGFPMDKVLRFNAIKHNNPALGCTKSHYEVLKMAKENNWKNVLILEDDFKMVVSKEELNESLNYFFNIQFEKLWDVLMFAYNIGFSHNKVENYNDDKIIGRIRFAQTASAYFVNANYFDKILSHMEEGIKLFEQTGRDCYMNDVYWRFLQEKDEWFYFKKRISIQRESYSDLQKSIANYGV